jgi:hypothetical protein
LNTSYKHLHKHLHKHTLKSAENTLNKLRKAETHGLRDEDILYVETPSLSPCSFRLLHGPKQLTTRNAKILLQILRRMTLPAERKQSPKSIRAPGVQMPQRPCRNPTTFFGTPIEEAQASSQTFGSFGNPLQIRSPNHIGSLPGKLANQFI